VNRATLAESALDLIQSEGLDALTMRTLADHTGVKAASLYWHVRDREELIQLVADALLARVHLPAKSASLAWRRALPAMCAATTATVSSQRDGGRILLSAPEALSRSALHADVVRRLTAAGLSTATAMETAAMLLMFVISQSRPLPHGKSPGRRKIARLAIDSGSRGVVVRAGADMDTLVRIPHDPNAAAPAVIRGDDVIVRRLRGGKHGELELNPAHPWSVRVQGPTWNTILDLSGIDLREFKLDSSATKVECILPTPRGVVPIKVSSGVVHIAFRRPPGTAVIADVSGAAVQIHLDGFRPRTGGGPVHWETSDGSATADRYELTISSGAVRVSMDQSAPPVTIDQSPEADAPDVPHFGAVELLLDAIGQRVATRKSR